MLEASWPRTLKISGQLSASFSCFSALCGTAKARAMREARKRPRMENANIFANCVDPVKSETLIVRVNRLCLQDVGSLSLKSGDSVAVNSKAWQTIVHGLADPGYFSL